MRRALVLRNCRPATCSCFKARERCISSHRTRIVFAAGRPEMPMFPNKCEVPNRNGSVREKPMSGEYWQPDWFCGGDFRVQVFRFFIDTHKNRGRHFEVGISWLMVSQLRWL